MNKESEASVHETLGVVNFGPGSYGAAEDEAARSEEEAEARSAEEQRLWQLFTSNFDKAWIDEEQFFETIKGIRLCRHIARKEWWQKFWKSTVPNTFAKQYVKQVRALTRIDTWKTD